jgi:hypothetical protein
MHFEVCNSSRKIQLGNIKLLSNGQVGKASLKKPNFSFVIKEVCEIFEFTMRFETVSRKLPV